MKIAIVGAEESKWTKEQKDKVMKEINRILHGWRYATEEHLPGTRSGVLDHMTLVSGGCPKGGVDIWAEEIADKLEIKKEIYPAEVYQWNDQKEYFLPKGLSDYYMQNRPVKRILKGYHSRNIQIAKACDVLYCINPRGIWSGGTWTMIYANKLGKEVHLVEIE